MPRGLIRIALVAMAAAMALPLGAGPAAADPPPWAGHGRRHHGPRVVYGAPVYVAPAPVYVAPRRVYVAPAPVYVAPAPVYVAPPPVVYPAPGLNFSVTVPLR